MLKTCCSNSVTFLRVIQNIILIIFFAAIHENIRSKHMNGYVVISYMNARILRGVQNLAELHGFLFFTRS